MKTFCLLLFVGNLNVFEVANIPVQTHSTAPSGAHIKQGD